LLSTSGSFRDPFPDVTRRFTRVMTMIRAIADACSWPRAVE
jgi:hypothetical protein